MNQPYAPPRIDWPQVGEQVLRQYAAVPERVEQLLLKMGAQHLSNRGSRIQCTCPIHGGDNPRGLAVYMDQKDVPVYQCFTHCGRGNLATAVQKKYGVRYSQAVTFLAEQIGVSIEGQTFTLSEADAMEAEELKWKRKLQLKKTASPNYFPEEWVDVSRQNLRAPQCRAVMDYLLGPADQLSPWGDRKRQCRPETLDRWEVGFVPARTWVWEEPDTRRGGTKPVGWFEDRISVPWRDINGHLIGFSGRRVDGVGERKYQTLNGTLKQFALYGLHRPEAQQAIRERREMVLVEGFADVWRAHEHQAYHTVAVGGTYLSPQQRRLIGFFVTTNTLDRVVLMFDGDDAGRVTAANLAKQVYSMVHPYIASVPEKGDPADILDPQAFWGLIRSARAFTV